jgi:hypothetical protein
MSAKHLEVSALGIGFVEFAEGALTMIHGRFSLFCGLRIAYHPEARP